MEKLFGENKILTAVFISGKGTNLKNGFGELVFPSKIVL